VRTIIAGGRDVTDPKLLQDALLACGWKPTTVICGGARGADTLGKEWGKRNDIPVEEFEAEWAQYGRRAGMMRNAQMAENAQAVIALWDGLSPGTANMITIARARKLKLYVHLV
jgi:predicted Rossmann-fold nucleotide-binding protein